MTSKALKEAMQQAEMETAVSANWEPELPPILAARFVEVVRFYQRIEWEMEEDFSFQLPGIKRVAAHGSHGFASQGNVAVVLERV